MRLKVHVSNASDVVAKAQATQVGSPRQSSNSAARSEVESPGEPCGSSFVVSEEKEELDFAETLCDTSRVLVVTPRSSAAAADQRRRPRDELSRDAFPDLIVLTWKAGGLGGLQVE